MNLSTKSTTTFLAFLAATSGVNAGCADSDGPGTTLGMEAAKLIVEGSDWFEQNCLSPMTVHPPQIDDAEAECKTFAINYCIGNMKEAVEELHCQADGQGTPPPSLMNTWSEECSDEVSNLLSTPTPTPAPTPAPYTPDFSDVTYYFDSELAADPYADVPASKGSKSTGRGTVTVKSDGTVKLDIAWHLRGDDGGIPSYNALKGIHIHKGDEDTNGPIVFGFCGQDPLPSFEGTCQQGWSSKSAQVATQYDGKICDITGNDSPCYMNGHATAAEAAQALIDGEDMYLNIHTTKSLQANGEAGPLGLIRGQLKLKEESSVYPTTTTGTDKVVVVEY